jgi:hypothetical protein
VGEMAMMVCSWLDFPILAGEKVKTQTQTRTTIREARTKANWELSPVNTASHDLQGISREVYWEQTLKGEKKGQQKEYEKMRNGLWKVDRIAFLIL